VDLLPSADVLYACDARWWKYRKGMPGFKGLKLTPACEAAVLYPDVQLVRVVPMEQRLLTKEPGVWGYGGNSGFQMLNGAIQFGAKKIILVGFDMTLEHGVHFHGWHAQGLANPTEPDVVRWRRALDDAAPGIAALGIEVLNASPISLLQAYERAHDPALWA
jgi:hypothetical protein